MTSALKTANNGALTQIFILQTCLLDILSPNDATKLELALMALKSLAKEDKVFQEPERSTRILTS